MSDVEKNSGFTHLDENLTPRMVDVGDKSVTRRVARARAVVVLTDEIAAAFRSGDRAFSLLGKNGPVSGGPVERGQGTASTASGATEISGPKGPVFRTAIIAGIMAAKRTHELIPLCHPIPLDSVSVDISFISETEIEILTMARATHKTGVEMEALQAASTAALTIYDMCKALGHGMIVRDISLVSKEGGKHDYLRA